MNERLFLIVKKLMTTLAYLIIGLWSLLTIIVAFFLIDSWSNPGYKSISNHDLKDYGKVTLIMIIVVGFMFFVKTIIDKHLRPK